MNQLQAIAAFAATLPYREIPNETGGIYLVRYYVSDTAARNQGRAPSAVFLHNIRLPDWAKEQHTHPWDWFDSHILHGGYTEERGTQTITYKAGDSNRFDNPRDGHRIVQVEPDTWSLVMVGPKVPSWGFIVAGEVVPWRKHLTSRGIAVPEVEL